MRVARQRRWRATRIFRTSKSRRLAIPLIHSTAALSSRGSTALASGQSHLNHSR
ncbi:hypothetical protein EDD90_7421 [Streptomyces sp. Ag109_O5-1]|nr:hypothetical protein EDD90_7421 [Streptomyces sp. Ag109_O5-1]